FVADSRGELGIPLYRSYNGAAGVNGFTGMAAGIICSDGRVELADWDAERKCVKAREGDRVSFETADKWRTHFIATAENVYPNSTIPLIGPDTERVVDLGWN